MEVMLNGLIWAVNDTKYGFVKQPQILDRDGDSYPELMVKFDRRSVAQIMLPGYINLSISGQIQDKYFIGWTSIRIRGN